jgi:hypothetical protein
MASSELLWLDADLEFATDLPARLELELGSAQKEIYFFWALDRPIKDRWLKLF